MFADYHMHSSYSPDSDYPMEDVVKDAIEMGLEDICFTDHVDYGVQKDHDDLPVKIKYGVKYLNTDYPNYYRELMGYRERYKDKISIKLGLEFGMQVHTIEKYRKLFSSYPFDFIILSVHQVNDLELWNNEYQEGKSQEEYNLGYYQEILNVIRQYKDYSVLGHLDAIVRYDNKGSLAFEKIESIVREILEQVIVDGKGIELNTSHGRYGLNDTTPQRQILEIYKELGGRIITIGSDSHKPSHLGQGIQEGKEILKELGFTEFCTFDKMEAKFHRL